AHEGSSTGDKDRYLFNFWEIDLPDPGYEFFQFSPAAGQHYSGNDAIVRWEGGKGTLAKSSAARIQGLNALGKKGIIIGRVGEIKIGYYSQHFFDKSCVVLIPNDEWDLNALYSFLSSAEFVNAVKSLDPRLSKSTMVFEKVPFDMAKWKGQEENRVFNHS